jgi:hypothetical protein
MLVVRILLQGRANRLPVPVKLLNPNESDQISPAKLH